ncbi:MULTISPECIES: nucleotide exchange factor GrpE [unclassified Thermosynechococcus]|uniref:nucleotide exchange factor GrpE n=1 Tax=unclassified Thermosynechococcus TaxID=2622553 RepID=UPI002873EEB3|nr:nucleotide exchange factor GrpE [Thermosynechococcus sp. PKX95]WNC35594.1 nucleotide exchange factor GrpE [Thermosynechococcus sp. PKX91]WNC38115.1 nucleotide exchange factor GrpE [Thermosynechococcus sp. WL11]WNC40636.1 nucleotide exchange factor GrpE [Thermosynechococcus sp. WL17]WNC43156.1 nucleotide exchange factor GrpE [Thermosynechococcus sp. WL15]
MSDETLTNPAAEAQEGEITPDVVENHAEATTSEEGQASEATSTDTSADAADLLEKIAALEAAKASLSQVVEERNSQYMRLAADFENFRKRTQREKEELELQIKCSVIADLLPVVDSFELARTHIQTETEAEEKIHRSYQGVYKQLVECLKRIGVSAMQARGKPFDPNLHEAVLREATNEHPEGTVIEELKRGYMLGDRVLRHAMVKVAAPPEEGSASDTNPTNDVTDV